MSTPEPVTGPVFIPDLMDHLKNGTGPVAMAEAELAAELDAAHRSGQITKLRAIELLVEFADGGLTRVGARTVPDDLDDIQAGRGEYKMEAYDERPARQS